MAHRLAGSSAKLVVTDVGNRPKLGDVGKCPPIVTISGGTFEDVDFHAALEKESTVFEPVPLASSAGEPLNPGVMRWFDEKLDCPLGR